MKKFAALLNIEFASKSQIQYDGIFSRIKKIVFSILGYGCLAALFLYAIGLVMNIFISTDMQHEFIIVFSLFMMIFHLVIGASMATKVFFTQVDLSILKLPVNGVGVLLPKLTYLYVKHLFLALIISLPTFIMFGVKTGMGYAYYLMLVPNIMFLPVIPLLLSVLLSVPAMWIIRIFKNRFIVLIVFYTALLIAGFTLYVYALKFILRVLESGNYANVFDSSTILYIKNFVSNLHIAVLFKNCLLLYNFAKSALINAAATLLLFAIVYFFADKFYFGLLISSKNQPSFKKVTAAKERGQASALISKEFKNIFRSTNYAFQYISVVLTTPIMVYFSSEIAASVGIDLLGASILPGIVVFVLITFLTMGTSFSATSITREGDNFFLTKIIPVSFTKQIAVKFLIYILISIPAIFISCLVLYLTHMVNLLAALLIAVALSFVIIGNICNSINMDIKDPQFKYLENGEVVNNNKNISASIGIGFIIAFVMGVGGIFLSLFVSVPSVYMALFGFGVPFAIIECSRLFFNLEARYNAIEV